MACTLLRQQVAGALPCNNQRLASRLSTVSHVQRPQGTRRWQQLSCMSQQQPTQSSSTSQPAHFFLARGALQQHLLGVAAPSAGLVAGLAILAFLACDSAQAASDPHHHAPLFDLAEDEDFWANVLRYGRYFVTVMLGTGYVMVKPVLNAFKKPVTAVVAIVAIVGISFGIKVTLEAMLGMSEYAYQLGEDVPMAPTPYI